jgi:Putative Actinobacterial Holin-X, holin superfamily III
MATQHPGGPGDSEDLRERSIGELLKQLSEETSRLVHQELELAKAELTQKGSRPGPGRGCSASPAPSGCWPPPP